MRAAVVCTTIFDPHFLPPLCANLDRYAHKEDTTIWIIPDRKTPPSAAVLAADWQRRGFDVRFVTLGQQEEFLARVPEIAALIPYDSDNRRNVGFLLALDQRADLLITIDDDNYPRIQDDFIGQHDIINRTAHTVTRSDTGWFNLCEMLIVDPPYPIHPRGFPYRLRRAEAPDYHTRDQSYPIGMNVGLWFDDPDVDAITRNFHKFRVTGWDGNTKCLAPGTWTPINTQNTALLAELIPAYYYVRMNEPIEGLRIDRFGDILSGLFCKKVCDHLGYAVQIGAPVCDHRRTPHNLLRDLHQELAGIALLEELTAWLERVQLKGDGAAEAYLSLADGLEATLPTFNGYLWGDDARAFFARLAHAMRAWVQATRIIAHDRHTLATAAG